MMMTRRKWTRRHFSLKLIEESDLGFCLHFALQNLHIQPGVFMGFRTANDPVPDGERSFMLASIKKALMDGDIPVKQKNFSKNQQQGGNS